MNPEEAKMWGDFRAEIDRRLDEARPKRASMGEYDWREPVYGWARNHLPNEQDLVHRTAKTEVDNREREATKKGNALLRDYIKGIRPLDWMDLGPKPIKVDEYLRVRWDAATPEDVDKAAKKLLADATATFREVESLAKEMHELAGEAREAGLLFVALLGNKPQRGKEAA